MLLSAHQEIARRDMETLRGAFGPLLCSRLDDPDVTDVLLNGDGVLFEDRKFVGMNPIGTMSENDAMLVINLVASIAGETVGRRNPVLEGELPIRNARFIAFIPPYSTRPTFSIRLPPTGIYTLSDYVAGGIMTYRQCEVIETAIETEVNLLVSGGTKSGKNDPN